MLKRPFLPMLLLLAACSGDPDPSPALERYQSGDTLVVRSSAPSWEGQREWRATVALGALDGPPETSFGRIVSIGVLPDGRILVVDRQVPTIRVFGPRGDYLESWGRRGEGPGELENPDAGLAVLPDGRVVVRDHGNARLQLFTSAGAHQDTWPLITGQYINRRPFGLQADTLINPDLVNPTDPLPQWRLGLVRIDPAGRILDTLSIPDLGRRAHRFIARSGGNASEIDLPFAPTEHWAWHPDGFVVHGVSDEYALTLHREGRPLRIQRDLDPIRVTSAEREQEEQRVLNTMRWLDRGWRWEGPRIPDEKPFFVGILTGADGRIWVRREGEAYETEDPDYDPSDPFDTEIRWRSEEVLDAFEPDGEYLGSTIAPRDLDWRVPPVLKADTMWAVVRDALGVQRLMRYELHLTGG